MQKPQAPTRHWKQVHRSGVESNSSLNSSMNSNHSSASAGYNRFQFQRASTEKDTSKRNNIFQFTARNRHNPHDVSVLTRQQQTTPKTPQARTQVQIASMASMEHIFRRMSTYGFEKDTKKMVSALLKEVKAVMDNFKEIIEQFKKEYKALRWDWNHTVKILIAKEVSFEESAVRQLQMRLDERDRELERLGKQSSFWSKNGGNNVPEIKHEFRLNSKGSMRQQSRVQVKGQSYNSWVESPLKNLNISKVDLAKNQDNISKLSRNNTLQSLLGPQFHNQLTNTPAPRSSNEITTLRERMSRMREILSS